MRITNVHNISLPLAVWLLQDNYDYINDEKYISATSLLRPTKQIILAKHVLTEDKEMDISERISAAFGNSIHDSVELAWKNPGPALAKLGYPQSVIEKIRVNPTPEEIAATPGIIPVWIEHRTIKEIAGYKVGGKLDFCADGRLFDFKTTSVFSYLKENKTEDYSLQGSIYRWLNPELVTVDILFLNFIFTDWQKFMIRQNPDYPKLKIIEKNIPLKSLHETQVFITNKLNELTRLWDKTEDELPPCNDKELWRSEPEYKYYSDPEKAKDSNARSSKNFDNLAEANAHMAEKGKGIVKTIPGQVKACAYCPAYSVCKQKDAYNV